MPSHYDLIAIDLDGTLVGRTGAVSQENLEAVWRARRAGIGVTICTGRVLSECHAVLDMLEQLDPVVVSGGAQIACGRERRTLDGLSLESSLIDRVTELASGLDLAMMIQKERDHAGYDYVILPASDDPDAELHPVLKLWKVDKNKNEAMGVSYCIGREGPMHHIPSVRAVASGSASEVAKLSEALANELAGLAMFHAFPLSTHVPEDAEPPHVLEVFPHSADKWSALQKLVDRVGVSHDRIAAIGDQANDLHMLEGAALGVAMGEAPDFVKAKADRIAEPCAEHGVALTIDRILSGEW
ncbi:MAG: HAD hydrolase family protein [Phycisphaerales bacterium]|jgi:hydroxymethylpyrimidine pyrophosphatase-like HAD family hydrolase